MEILVIGASGFIASQIVADLIIQGHSVTCCVRNTSYAKKIFPSAKVIACNFIQDTRCEDWVERLKNIDIVINCVGIFYHPNKKYIWTIHYDSPKALFDACVQIGIKKIIQISALGIDKVNLEYAKSKKAADDYLLTLPIQAVILRPSLVYGRGSYGGTSLFRGLSGLPWFTPLPGKGAQACQPIHLEDLSKAIMQLISTPFQNSILLNAVGPEKIKLNEILTIMRAWLGFSKTKFLCIPLWFIRLITLIGDLIPYSTINTTAYKLLLQNNITSIEDTEKFHQQIGFIPRNFKAGIYSHPSTVQDHWHARLYFLKPILRISISFIWLFTAACSLFFYPKNASYDLLAQVGITPFWQPFFLFSASILDAIFGAMMLFGYQLKKSCVLQLIVILIYSAIITWKLPHLLLEPFAPIIKNISIITAILVLLALESDR